MLNTIKNKRYRADIDGLRAIAVLMVVLFHFNLVPYADAGFLGVDVFFVISGFLITSIIVSQLESNGFTLGRFYSNRIRRLAPALTITLLLTLAIGSLLLFPVDFRELAYQTVVAQFYVSNIHYWLNINYFGLNAENVFLLHTWSLAVEEQFYLFYPLALILLYRLNRKLIWPFIWAGMLTSLFLNIYFVETKPEATFYLFPTRAWELLVGSICYQLTQRQGRLDPRLCEFIGLAGLGLIVVSIFTYNNEISIPGCFALLPVFGAAAVIYSGTFVSTKLANALGNKLFTYVGRISYPLYLVHWPVDVFARLIFEEGYSAFCRLSMLLLSLMLAAGIYHCVEIPLQRGRSKEVTIRRLWQYGLSVIVTVIVFAGSEITNGFSGRYSKEVLLIMDYSKDHTESKSECAFDHESSLESSQCVIGMPGVEATWFIYGDSHAWAAKTVFDEWLKRRGESGFFVFRSSCPPLSGLFLFGDLGRCKTFNEEVSAQIISSDRIDRVLLVSTWRQAIESRLTSSPNKILSRSEGIALFKKQFSETVETYAKAGKSVYVWEPVPGARGNVPRAMARGLAKGAPVNIDKSRDNYKATYRFFFEALEENRQWIAGRYSPALLLCDDQVCAATIDGKPAYFDGSHITKSLYPHWVDMMEKIDGSVE